MSIMPMRYKLPYCTHQIIHLMMNPIERSSSTSSITATTSKFQAIAIPFIERFIDSIYISLPMRWSLNDLYIIRNSFQDRRFITVVYTEDADPGCKI